MLPAQVASLPKGWPPMAPTAVIVQKLHDGKVLNASELRMLKAHAQKAEELERTDPDYQRACKRWRAQQAEEDRICETRKALEEKMRGNEGVRERVSELQQAKREARARRQERNRGRSDEVSAAREARRSQLIERIALSERRQLVRETIQRALVSQSRSDNFAERVTFTNERFLGDAPGPGTYEPARPVVKGTRFGSSPHADVRTREQWAPGPGAYDPKYGSGPAITMGGLVGKRAPPQSDAPGPGAYDYVAPQSKGGKISHHVVRSEMDMALERAALEPVRHACASNHAPLRRAPSLPRSMLFS